MTKEEQWVLALAGKVYEQARALPEMHPSDMREIEFHTHGIQNIILAREGLRTLEQNGFSFKNKYKKDD